VAHVWLVNPVAETLEVLRLDGGRWVVVASCVGDVTVQAEPFEAIDLDLSALWDTGDSSDPS
jgi:hypothetical protein